MSLYNKYRPKTVEEVVGQDHITSVIKVLLKNDNIPHFLILAGPSGTGKTTLARIIAKELNDSTTGTIEKDSALYGGKDDMKALQEALIYKPIEGNYKTIIFDESHKITEAAFSALLKTTEEPPEYIKFIFVTTDLNSIPDTIKTRAQIHTFFKIEDKIIINVLKDICTKEKFLFSADELKLIAGSSGGSMRAAIGLLEKASTNHKEGTFSVQQTLGISDSFHYNKFIVSCIERDLSEAITSLDVASQQKTDPMLLVFGLQEFLMDLRFRLLGINNPSKFDLEASVNHVSRIADTINDTKTLDKFNKQLANLLDSIFDQTLVLENNLKRNSNTKAILTRFALEVTK